VTDGGELDVLRELRIPKALHDEVEQIMGLTDGFAVEHLDTEYGDLCRRLVARLARKRPSPLMRGDLRIWAAAIIHTIGSINFLFDRTQSPHMTGHQLSALTGVPKSTLANKARLIKDALRLQPIDPTLCRWELLAEHPFAWLVEINGVLVDVRRLPVEVQIEAHRRGVIPTRPGAA